MTIARVREYVRLLSEREAPSTAASVLRTPLLRKLLAADGAFDGRLHLHANFNSTGSTVLLTGSDVVEKPLWYFAHLDTLSYLVQPRQHDRYPLVPFGYHLAKKGRRSAVALRFDLERLEYGVVARGEIGTEGDKPFFRPQDSGAELYQGDRVVLHTNFAEDETTGNLEAHVDNAGGVAALAVAAPVLARADVPALIAFPDEEEGPPGAGSQMMGRGSARIVNALPPPDLAIVSDMQQAGGEDGAVVPGGIENTSRLGGGAVLAEFSSNARGAVTPPHLYALARLLTELLNEVGVQVQESNNAYTSRSDDVSVILRTPHVLLLGFPGFDRHFDTRTPRANLRDIADLAKCAVYFSALRPVLRKMLTDLAGN